jgi:hypothetical protein
VLADLKSAKVMLADMQMPMQAKDMYPRRREFHEPSPSLPTTSLSKSRLNCPHACIATWPDLPLISTVYMSLSYKQEVDHAGPEARSGCRGVVRMTIILPEPLKEELDQCAAKHSRLYEPVDTSALIPHLLEAFVRSDRGWRSRKARAGRAPQRGASPASGRSDAQGDSSV